MKNRLPKQFWRVVVLDGSSLRTYDRASKTYADEHHAISAQRGFQNRGIPAQLWTTGPVEWQQVVDTDYRA